MFLKELAPQQQVLCTRDERARTAEASFSRTAHEMEINMHRYLRSIGFYPYFSSEYEIDQFLSDLFQTSSEQDTVPEGGKKRIFIERSALFGPNMGIRVCGEMDEHGFHRLFYFPYLKGSTVTTTADLTIEKKVNGENYCCQCDDSRVGISIIFYLQNPAQFRKKYIVGKKTSYEQGITLTALADKGKILIPGKKRVQEPEAYIAENIRHDSLVAAAREGSQEAIESLTMEDIDNYAMVTRRLLREDILSIVDTYFMPYGMECEQYQILGNIRFFAKVRNALSGQYIYQMSVECNGMSFDVCINEHDLVGEPEIGRRFKGNIWLQGSV